MTVVAFPVARAGNPSIAGMRCEECGAAPMIFIDAPPSLRTYCSPTCAASCGEWPWRDADLERRSHWAGAGEMTSDNRAGR